MVAEVKRNRAFGLAIPARKADCVSTTPPVSMGIPRDDRHGVCCGQRCYHDKTDVY